MNEDQLKEKLTAFTYLTKAMINLLELSQYFRKIQNLVELKKAKAALEMIIEIDQDELTFIDEYIAQNTEELLANPNLKGTLIEYVDLKSRVVQLMTVLNED